MCLVEVFWFMVVNASTSIEYSPELQGRRGAVSNEETHLNPAGQGEQVVDPASLYVPGGQI